MKLSDFDFDLPEELIAQKPVRPRDSSRLMVVKGDKIEHRHFRDITEYFKEGDVLVLNETKVSRAKLTGKRATGSDVELILTRKLDSKTYLCRIKGNRPKEGQKHIFHDGLESEIIGRDEKDAGIYKVRFNKDLTEEIIESFELPTPPYIGRKLESDDEYQTAFSKKEGSVAAPTAGFHFTEEIFKRLEKVGVEIVKICLHIDFGTFIPIEDESIVDHKMHEEHFEITQEAADAINNRRGRLFVVGTTSLRALESSNKDGKVIPQKSETDIFIYPGYRFKERIDGMITNFHFPRSTLILLVSALFGKDTILDAYKIAVENRYRFYSFGDAMLLLR